MSIDFNRLKEMPIDDLKQLAVKEGVTFHHRISKPETLAKLIIEHVTQPQKAPEMKHPAEQPTKAAPVLNTEDEVREACERYFAKDGFRAEFEDDTWRFRYKGAEDSGHMTVPLRVIKMKAMSVAQGAKRPFIVKNELGQEVMLAGA